MTTTPELVALQDVCGRIEAAGIAYMLTGSLAMAYYARPRMTRDIDLVIELSPGASDMLAKALGPDYFLDEEALHDAMRDERPCNALHLPTMVKIDLMPRKAEEYRRFEFERRQRVSFGGVGLWIVSREDLILSKLDWARDSHSELQLRDVRHLLEGPVEWSYLVTWAGHLGVDELLEETRRE